MIAIRPYPSGARQPESVPSIAGAVRANGELRQRETRQEANYGIRPLGMRLGVLPAHLHIVWNGAKETDELHIPRGTTLALSNQAPLVDHVSSSKACRRWSWGGRDEAVRSRAVRDTASGCSVGAGKTAGGEIQSSALGEL